MYTLAQTPETCTTLVGTSALKSSTLATLNASFKQRKFPGSKYLPRICSRDPILAKTKYAGEKILMNSMVQTGKPYKTPEQLSGEISKQVREEKDQTKDLRQTLTE